MFRDRPGWKPVPYTPWEREEMEEDARMIREEREDQFAQEEREKIAEWTGSHGRTVSMHFDPSGNIYFKVLFERQWINYRASDLRRPTAEEKKDQPDVYAVLDNGEHRRGLTKERYLVLRAKLV